MNALPFDTLALAKELESAGFERKTAEGASAALAGAFSSMATKDDLELLKRDITIRLGGMLIVGFGAMAALLKLL